MDLKRCFVAIDFSTEDKKILHNLGIKILTQTPKSARVRVVPPQNLHLTLLFLGSKSTREIDEFLASYEPEFSRLLVPTTITLTTLSCFEKRSQKVIWFNGDYGSLSEQLACITPGFTPHITIARAKNLPRVPDHQFSITITPRQITLFESVLESQGPVYKELAIIRKL